MSPIDRLYKLVGKKRPRKKKRASRRIPLLESKAGARMERPVPPRRYAPSILKEKLLFLVKRTALWGGGGVTFILIAFYLSLPNIDSLGAAEKTPSILIKSEDGQIIGSFGDIYGDFLVFDELPTSLVDAVIATEDRNFYHHFGVDPFGLMRAFYANARAGHVVQGGSTVTQQVAKNVFLTPERTFSRKLREMLLAIKLERRYNKKQIMSIYLNRVYFGAGNYGVDAAARRYFDKSARDLTLGESAILAGLLKAPSRFAPTANPTLSRKRAEQVIVNMQDAEYLTKPQADKARQELTRNMNARKRSPQSNYYFADWVMDQLPEYVGDVREDLVVTTTLNPEWQALAEKSINEVMDKEGDAHLASQAALLAMTPDGAIRAMIGGRSYGESQYNRATQSLRQPGSSFKLFVYLAGLESGLTPDSMVDDRPITVGKWSPKNYNGKYLGAISLREAVANSINTVAVQVSQRSGLSNVINVAHRLGVTADLDPLPSIALGSTEVSLLEMTTAYAHLAANGTMVYPYGITSIVTTSGKTLYRYTPERGGAALSSYTVSMMNDLLSGVISRGTGRAAQIGRPAAGKTGTTSDYKDAWFMGYTPDLAAGVWVGNDDNSPMKKVTGGMLPASIWHNFMQAALAGTPTHSLPLSSAPAPLPWQQPDTDNDTPTYPEQPDHTVQSHDAPVRKHGGKDVELGPSFWDKLLGGK